LTEFEADVFLIIGDWLTIALLRRDSEIVLWNVVRLPAAMNPALERNSRKSSASSQTSDPLSLDIGGSGMTSRASDFGRGVGLGGNGAGRGFSNIGRLETRVSKEILVCSRSMGTKSMAGSKGFGEETLRGTSRGRLGVAMGETLRGEGMVISLRGLLALSKMDISEEGVSVDVLERLLCRVK